MHCTVASASVYTGVFILKYEIHFPHDVITICRFPPHIHFYNLLFAINTSHYNKSGVLQRLVSDSPREATHRAPARPYINIR